MSCLLVIVRALCVWSLSIRRSSAAGVGIAGEGTDPKSFHSRAGPMTYPDPAESPSLVPAPTTAFSKLDLLHMPA